MRTPAALGALALAMALPVLPLTAAHAGDTAGAGFGSVSLTATAHGQEFLFRQEIPGQLSVPYAQSSLRFGEGTSTATVAWPGDTAASLGTTAILLGAPEQATVLNDPAVAYARSGAGDADVQNTTVPGATMHATATKQKATALAAADGSQALSTTAGSSSSQTAVQLTGAATATGTATSSVRDVTFAGVVHVASVTSTATGATDGQQADAHGSTTVTGLTVAGVPVTVDEHGVSAAGTTVVPAGAADPVTEALKQAQVTLVLTTPIKAVKGGKVEYSTGALVAITPLGTVTLGGAQLVLGATVADAPAVDVPATGPSTLPTLVAEPPAAPLEVVQPGLGADPPPAVGPTLPHADRPNPLLAAVPVSVRTGYGWAWVVSGLLLTFLAASGLLGLSRRWLAPDLSGCPLEGGRP